MLTGVFYGRFSSKMQNETSIEGQRIVVANYAQMNNIKIVTEYVDRAKSGKSDKRPNFKKMIDDIKNGTLDIDVVVVYKLDRFFRNEKLHRKHEDILNEHGVNLLSATEQVNDNTNFGQKAYKALAMLVNEEEVKKISQNVSRGKLVVAKSCKWCGGKPPLGYDVDKETQMLIINKTEAKAVRFAFRMRAQGASLSAIIEQMNRRGFKTKLGNKFGKNSLHEIFKNIKYKGVYEYNRAVSKSPEGKFNRHASKSDDEIVRIKDGCPRIVSDEIWDKVNAMGKKHSSIKPKGDYLLSGLVVCKCGTSMQVNRRNNHQKEYLSFFCPKHKNKQGCNAKEIDLNKLENFVLSKLADLIFTKDKINQFIECFSQISDKKQKKIKSEIRELKSEKRTNTRKIQNCITQIEDGCLKIVADRLGKRIEELEYENKRIDKKLKRLHNNVSDVPDYDEIEALKDNFIHYMQEKNNLPIRKEFLQKVIETIKITDDKIEIVFNL